MEQQWVFYPLLRWQCSLPTWKQLISEIHKAYVVYIPYFPLCYHIVGFVHIHSYIPHTSSCHVLAATSLLCAATGPRNGQHQPAPRTDSLIRAANVTARVPENFWWKMHKARGMGGGRSVPRDSQQPFQQMPKVWFFVFFNNDIKKSLRSFLPFISSSLWRKEAYSATPFPC